MLNTGEELLELVGDKYEYSLQENPETEGSGVERQTLRGSEAKQ